MIDYRRIIKSKNLRIKLLSYLSWVPDSLIVRLQYFVQTGRILHLDSPVLFNEKLQFYKIKYRDPEMLRCTDKLEVRTFIEEKGLSNILVPLIGVYNDINEIDFEQLPNNFVIKTTDGGGGNQVHICFDKSKENKNEFFEKIKSWMQMPKPKKHIAREWAYDNPYPRKLIVEELLQEKNSEKKDIDDYKFFCFNGKFKVMQLHKDRYENHKAGFWDENLDFLPDVSILYPTFDSNVPLPSNINEMIEIAEELSKGFPYVRVDLYNVNNKIYFSELTFYPASGYIPFNPITFDKLLGSYFSLPVC